MTQKEKREQSTSLTPSEVLGKPIRIKRVNAHAERRELSTSVLYGFVKFPNYQKARIKSGRSVLCPYVCYVTIRCCYFVTTMSLETAQCGICVQI